MFLSKSAPAESIRVCRRTDRLGGQPPTSDDLGYAIVGAWAMIDFIKFAEKNNLMKVNKRYPSPGACRQVTGKYARSFVRGTDCSTDVLLKSELVYIEARAP